MLGYVCGDYGLIDNDKWIDLHSMSENSEKNVKLCINKMNELAEENEQLKQQKDKWKQQCIHFKEMLDDMDIAYLCDEWIYGELKGDVE